MLSREEQDQRITQILLDHETRMQELKESQDRQAELLARVIEIQSSLARNAVKQDQKLNALIEVATGADAHLDMLTKGQEQIQSSLQHTDARLDALVSIVDSRLPPLAM